MLHYLIAIVERLNEIFVEVYTTIGQLILAQKITSINTPIDLKNYPAGLYHVKVMRVIKSAR